VLIVYGISWAWSSVNPVILVRLWRKLLPDLEKDDLQGFPNEEISKSKILVKVCAIRNFVNVNKDNEEWLQSDVCELGIQHMIDSDIISAAAKQKDEEEGGEDERDDEGESIDHVSHSMALQCVDSTRLHGSERVQIQWHYSHHENLYCHEEKCKQFTKISDHYKLFLKINFTCIKKCKVICDVL
jgi:hypothetical protein